MSLTPSRIQRIGGIEPTVRIVPEGVAFVAKSPEQATQIEAVLRANIEQRNADIDAGNRRIVGQVRPLLEQRIEVVRNEEAVAARAWAEAGLQDANRDDEARAEDSVPAPADEFSDAAQSTGARNVDTPVAEGQRADQDIAGDAALLAAVQLVAGTTSSDVKLRAIAQVKGVLQGWIDHTDERRLFGNILLVGLDELEAYVREDTSIAVSSIFDSIQRNIAQAAMWAQTSKYAQLGRDLIMLAQFVQSLIPKS